MRRVHPRSHLQLRVLVHVEKFAALLSCMGDDGSILLESLKYSILDDKDGCELFQVKAECSLGRIMLKPAMAHVFVPVL